MTITETNKGYQVKFSYDAYKVAALKQIQGAWFNSKEIAWYVPRHRQLEIERLRNRFGVTTVKKDPLIMPEVVEEIEPLPELSLPLNLPRELFSFQKTGVAYCLDKKKVIVGDQMGLGKTTQAIATIVAAKAFPCIVVCPASLKLNWQKEWMDVAGRSAMVLTDRVKNTWQKYFDVGYVDVFIVNYESLKKFFVQDIRKEKDKPLRLNHIIFKDCVKLFKSVIADESHKCKDGSTQQAKFMMGLCKNKEYVLELTGTPVVNKPKDLVSQLYILDKMRDIVSHIPQPVNQHGHLTDASGYTRFINRYCEGYNGASNLKELNWRLNKFCFYRREKTEVLKDLPGKIRQVLLCEITNREEYTKAEKQFVDYLKTVRGCSDAEVRKKLRGEVMVKMGILKQISARGKLEAVKDFVDEIIESGEKIILFCYLTEIIHAIRAEYPHALTIYGQDSIEERNKSVIAFQNNPKSNIIICNYKSGGVGLTLTASSRVAFVEFPWTFADCEQCEDRAHRIGQVDSVQCSYFLGENTIDRYCYELIQKKKTIAQTITGATDDVQEEFIDELLNLFNQK